jgi:hypothetical protein
MLFHAVEERADVAIPALESVRRNPQGRVVSFHASPPSGDRRVQRAELESPCRLRQRLWRVQRASRSARSSIAELRSGPALHCGSILRRPNRARLRLSPLPVNDRAAAAITERIDTRSGWTQVRRRGARPVSRPYRRRPRPPLGETGGRLRTSRSAAIVGRPADPLSLGSPSPSSTAMLTVRVGHRCLAVPRGMVVTWSQLRAVVAIAGVWHYRRACHRTQRARPASWRSVAGKSSPRHSSGSPASLAVA